MPGFSGIVSPKNKNDDQVIYDIERMTKSISHFADYQKRFYFFKKNEIAFSHASLDIPGLPTQEYHDRTNSIYTIVDGEISNFQDIKSHIGITTDTKNSAEIFTYIYRLYGFDCLNHCMGWFNVIIYDEIQDIFAIANDRYGIRPLYYSHNDSKLIFSSEIKAIIRALSSIPELDYESISNLFAFNGILNEKTLFRNVFRLPPASLWIYRDQTWGKKAYWSVYDRSYAEELCQAEALETGNQLFRQIARRHLRDSFIVSLTGGMDTRAIMSLVEQNERPTACFTYGISENTADDMIARRVARTLNIPYEFIPLDDSFLDDFPSYAEKAIWISDGMSDIEAASILHVFSKHRNSICVTGKYGNQVLRNLRSRVFEMNQEANLEVFSRDFLEEVRGYPRQSLDRAYQKFAELQHHADRNLFFTLLEECRRSWGGNLAIENSMTLIRTPYTEKELIEWILKLPSVMNMDFNLQKYIVINNDIRLARIPTDKGIHFLPNDFATILEAFFFRGWSFLGRVCNSRKVPPKLKLDETLFSNSVTTKYRTWYRGKLRDYVRELILDHRTLSREFFDPHKLRDIVDSHIHRKNDCSNQIRRVISFELFLRLFID